MKKKREITLRLKKVKIADLSTLNSVKGGTGTDNNCNGGDPGDPGTDGDSKKICTPAGNSGLTFSLSCEKVCPSIAVSISNC